MEAYGKTGCSITLQIMHICYFLTCSKYSPAYEFPSWMYSGSKILGGENLPDKMKMAYLFILESRFWRKNFRLVLVLYGMLRLSVRQKDLVLIFFAKCQCDIMQYVIGHVNNYRSMRRIKTLENFKNQELYTEPKYFF